MRHTVNSRVRPLVARAATLCVLTAALAASTIGIAEQALAGPFTSSPFVSSAAARVWYRIPAMVRTHDATIVAFAERRDTDSSDFGDFDIVARSSRDGGRTWGPLRVIADDGENRVSNPTPFVDPKTGDVCVFSSIRNANDTYKGLYLQRSRDGGATFTPLSQGRVQPSGGWKGGLTGPGHGIVLKHGEHAGRIVVPVGYRQGDVYGAYGILSDDGGASWRIGYDWADASEATALIEGTVCERSDGALLISYRNKRAVTPGYTRYTAVSLDGGESVQAGFARGRAPETHSVQAGLLALDGPSHGGTLVFSAPLYTTASDRTLRRDMGVVMSFDGGATWPRRYQLELESKPGSYSDLVQLDDATVGVLYETGTVTWRERITFRSVVVTDALSGVRVGSSVSGRISDTRVRSTQRGRVKTQVRVAGIASPPGTVVVTCTRAGAKAVSSSVRLTYSNKGVRFVTLPRLKPGTYRVTVKYNGTGRILPASRAIGTLRVSR